MYVILVYDIASELGGAGVQRKVFKACKRYLTHVQASVFEGEMHESQLVSLENELKDYLRNDMDSLIIFKSNNEKWLERKIVTNVEDPVDNYL